jgi:hypothetical protein
LVFFNQTAIAKLMLPWQQKIPMPLLLAVLQPLLGCLQGCLTGGQPPVDVVLGSMLSWPGP